jgi:hypothetical protein
MTDSDNDARHDSTGAEPARDACLRCGTTMQVVGVEELRTGGNTGVTMFFLGEWGELGEGKLELEMSVCPACRHVEFRAPE